MILNFTKMHGTGNDYIYVDCFKNDITLTPSQIAFLSDRHKGIGGDGVILVCPSSVADGRMQMYNLDGSRGLMCGNGVRCVGKFLYDNGYAKSPTVTVETDSGIKTLAMQVEGNIAHGASVQMGIANFAASAVPLNTQKDEYINCDIEINGKIYKITCLSMGNPHCVTLVDDVDSIDLTCIGVLFENHPLFPNKVNTEFVEIVSKNHLKMRVWERGSGETLSCGTGACAVAVCCVKLGLCDFGTVIKVDLLGGSLEIIYFKDGNVQMTGDAVTVFEGVLQLND